MSYLFIKKYVSKRKVCIIFIKNKKFQKTQKKPQKNIFSGFFGWVFLCGFFWVGFFGWFFVWVFIANPATWLLEARRPAAALPAEDLMELPAVLMRPPRALKGNFARLSALLSDVLLSR
jgi:hypothetical protein